MKIEQLEVDGNSFLLLKSNSDVFVSVYTISLALGIEELNEDLIKKAVNKQVLHMDKTCSMSREIKNVDIIETERGLFLRNSYIKKFVKNYILNKKYCDKTVDGAECFLEKILPKLKKNNKENCLEKVDALEIEIKIAEEKIRRKYKNRDNMVEIYEFVSQIMSDNICEEDKQLAIRLAYRQKQDNKLIKNITAAKKEKTIKDKTEIRFDIIKNNKEYFNDSLRRAVPSYSSNQDKMIKEDIKNGKIFNMSNFCKQLIKLGMRNKSRSALSRMIELNMIDDFNVPYDEYSYMFIMSKQSVKSAINRGSALVSIYPKAEYVEKIYQMIKEEEDE